MSAATARVIAIDRKRSVALIGLDDSRSHAVGKPKMSCGLAFPGPVRPDGSASHWRHPFAVARFVTQRLQGSGTGADTHLGRKYHSFDSDFVSHSYTRATPTTRLTLLPPRRTMLAMFGDPSTRCGGPAVRETVIGPGASGAATV